MADLYSFGEWIRKRRQALGLTQAALARQAGYSAAMLRKIESDERRPSPDGAASLAAALEIRAAQQEAFLQVARQERPVDRLGVVDQDEVYPWEAAAHPRTNLPVPATLFVGREKELAQISALLANPACRLVTLVGMAGIGKTRLAIRAAHDAIAGFAGGVFFVPLAPLCAPETIMAAIASAVALQFHGPAEPQQQLYRYLQGKQLLLLLDNFEHLIEGANLVAELLQAVPDIQLLVTTRERLNLHAEWPVDVTGLSYPTETDSYSREKVQSYEAVQLFTQSALRANPSFRLDETNQQWVVRICRLLEGIPLGLELAATWVRVLSCQEIARQVAGNLDILQTSVRDLPARHKSLRAALDHSWNLLADREQAVLRRLSVFRGGFRREAAHEVAEAGLMELASLLDKSLLRRLGDERYELHELVRQYAASHLHSNPEEEMQAQDRHSSCYATLLEQWEGQLRSARLTETLAEMDAEMDNVRQAWRWMLAQQQTENIQKSLRSLWNLYEIRGRLREGAELFHEASAVLATASETAADGAKKCGIVLGQLLAYEAYFLAHLTDFKEATARLPRSLALLRSGSDRAALADTLALHGYVHYRIGAFAEARLLTEESLDLNRALGNQGWVAWCLVMLAYIALAQGQYEEADGLSRESLAVSRDILGDPLATGDGLISLSTAARHLGSYAEARRWAEESLQLIRALDDHWGIALVLRQLGLIDLELGEIDRASALISQSVLHFKEVGDRMLEAVTRIDLAVAARVSGAYRASKAHLLEALAAAADTESRPVVLNALTEMAAVEMEEQRAERALELVRHCQQPPAETAATGEHSASASQLTVGRWGQQRPRRLEQLRAELEAQLAPWQVAEVEQRVRGRTLEGVVEELLAGGTDG